VGRNDPLYGAERPAPTGALRTHNNGQAQFKITTLTAVRDATIGLYKMRLFSQCIKHAVYKHAVYTIHLCLTSEFLCVYLCVNERVYYHCAPVQKSANVKKNCCTTRVAVAGLYISTKVPIKLVACTRIA